MIVSPFVALAARPEGQMWTRDIKTPFISSLNEPICWVDIIHYYILGLGNDNRTFFLNTLLFPAQLARPTDLGGQ